jgi:hypothetical protein
MASLLIIVVEDDVFIRLDLMTHLRAGGHTVVGTALRRRAVRLPSASVPS